MGPGTHQGATRTLAVMRGGSATLAAIRVAVVLGALAIVSAIFAALPRALSGTGSSSALVADVAPSVVILVAWILLAAFAVRSADTLWALPSDLFRATIVLGGATVIVARLVWFAVLRPEGAPRALVATTVEDVLYGLGLVALDALAAFAIGRTLLRPALRDHPAPRIARDVTLRTRFFVASAGAAFATAGILLDVLVDFERTPESALIGFLVIAAALVAFWAIIGLVVGDDTARAIELRAAALAERERIARELHDGVAKSVSVLALEAATIAARAPDPLRPDLGRVEHLARLLSEELRAIVTDVRLRDPSEPFSASLERVAGRYPGVRVELAGELDRVGTLARFELLRLLEEALRNASRHAAASEIVARVGTSDGHVELEVEDDGRGMSEVRWDELPRNGYFGLLGMRERAELLRGTIAVSSGERGGTRVHVTIPLRPE